MPRSVASIFADRQCVAFRLYSVFDITPVMDDNFHSFLNDVMSRSPANVLMTNWQLHANFGSLLKRRDHDYALRGNISRTPDETSTQISLTLSVQRHLRGANPPPRYMPSAVRLLDAFSFLFGHQSFICSVDFEYVRPGPWRSLITLPMPITLGSSGVTHLESAVFAKYVDDEHSYSIEVESLRSDEDPITHTVSFVTEDTLSRSAFGAIVQQAQEISTSLLIREEGEANG